MPGSFGRRAPLGPVGTSDMIASLFPVPLATLPKRCVRGYGLVELTLDCRGKAGAWPPEKELLGPDGG